MSRFLRSIDVHPDPLCPTRGLLQAGTSSWRCALGRASVAHVKREGDGATPLGTWPLRRIFYRPDRAPRPRSGLPVAALRPFLGWSDDVNDPQYNRLVHLPRRFGHESMWRTDRLYDYVVVLGHNDTPPLPCFGSAIFLHLAREGYRPTEGCIAVSRGTMQKLLPRIGSETVLRVLR